LYHYVNENLYIILHFSLISTIFVITCTTICSFYPSSCHTYITTLHDVPA